jgi:hypothetical protein
MLSDDRSRTCAWGFFAADLGHYLLLCPERTGRPDDSRRCGAGIIYPVTTGNDCAIGLSFGLSEPGEYPVAAISVA